MISFWFLIQLQNIFSGLRASRHNQVFSLCGFPGINYNINELNERIHLELGKNNGSFNGLFSVVYIEQTPYSHLKISCEIICMGCS